MAALTVVLLSVLSSPKVSEGNEAATSVTVKTAVSANEDDFNFDHWLAWHCFCGIAGAGACLTEAGSNAAANVLSEFVAAAAIYRARAPAR